MLNPRVSTPKVRTATMSGHINYVATRSSFAAFKFGTDGKLEGGFLKYFIPVYGTEWNALEVILPSMRAKDLYDFGYPYARYVCTTWLNEFGGLERRI